MESGHIQPNLELAVAKTFSTTIKLLLLGRLDNLQVQEKFYIQHLQQ